jgi:hypothetical protein
MKVIFGGVFTLIILFCSAIESQCQWYFIHHNQFDNDPNDSALVIGLEPGNVWQIGVPQKIIFTESYSPPQAIVTDTIDPYPINNYSTFEISFNNTIYQPIWILFEFWHKYHTDLNKDGCFIEVSFDNGNTWSNIISDTLINNWGNPQFQNFYQIEDTILGGIPAFSGSLENWTKCQIQWGWTVPELFENGISPIIRFVFQSDSNQTDKDGWVIDDILIHAGDYEGIEEIFVNDFYSEVFPNPVHSQSKISFQNNLNLITNINIYNSIGKLIKHEITSSNIFIIIGSEYPEGIYYYKLLQDNGKGTSTGKFIITK